MNIWSEFLTNRGRVIHKWTHYMQAYERHFSRFAYQSLTFIEIGVGEGGSLQMWKRYFGPFARIVGIDIDARCKRFEEDQIDVRIGNQSDAGFLQSIIDEFGQPEVILDDGSHVAHDIIAAFSFLYPRMQKNGVYMVEDLHTSYWPEYDGGLRRHGSFIELCKDLLDELNADWSREALPRTDFTASTLSMHFYDSLAVFERGRHIKKYAPKIGTWSIDSETK